MNGATAPKDLNAYVLASAAQRRGIIFLGDVLGVPQSFARAARTAHHHVPLVMCRARVGFGPGSVSGSGPGLIGRKRSYTGHTMSCTNTSLSS